MGTQERREREKAALRQKIIDKGREILVNEGSGALTMRRLAEEIEYTPGALYAHFADKESLVLAICTTDFVDFGRRFVDVNRIEDPIERLRQLAKVYARFGLEHPAQYRVIFILDASAECKQQAEFERGNPEQDAYAALEIAVARAIEAGHFVGLRARPQLVAQTLWAGIHGVVSIELRRTESSPIPLEDIDLRVDTMCNTLLAGLGAIGVAPPVLARLGARPGAPRAAVAKGTSRATAAPKASSPKSSAPKVSSSKNVAGRARASV